MCVSFDELPNGEPVRSFSWRDAYVFAHSSISIRGFIRAPPQRNFVSDSFGLIVQKLEEVR
jgi:hypothetical protein